MFGKLGNSRGMTLIEIMVVLAIMGVIMALVGTSVMDRLATAKVQAAKAQIKGFEDALEQYHLDNDAYPSTDQGLEALVAKPSGGRVPKHYPAKGYLKGGKVPKDPWGENYRYYSPGLQGHEYEIYANGKDKQEGTEDDVASFESESGGGE
ncbi:MAG: type II secretion system major pseudopilin GspG [Pseudomonadota bacterium]